MRHSSAADGSNQATEKMNLAIELEQEEDGRWIAEMDELDGVVVYGATRAEAMKNVKTLAQRVSQIVWRMTRARYGFKDWFRR